MKLSIIIPTFNEERNIEGILSELIDQHDPYEIIVADGGSTDQTRTIASTIAKVVRSEKGRAIQMNVGATVASGDAFLFLHADTRLPKKALIAVRDALLNLGKRAGRFRMSFGHPHWLLRFYEFHTRFHFFSYGDQGFFVTKELFDRLEGFRMDVPFEDIDFYKRLRKLEKPVILNERVVTSPRRFLQHGIVRQKMINIFLASMYYLGFKHSWIETCYKKLYTDTRKEESCKH